MKNNKKPISNDGIPNNFSFFANKSPSKVSIDSAINMDHVKNPIYDIAQEEEIYNLRH